MFSSCELSNDNFHQIWAGATLTIFIFYTVDRFVDWCIISPWKFPKQRNNPTQN